MINFRFHLVSLVAVFLALGVGIIVGSTVIDQATVQGLERNVDALRGQRESARDQRDEARDALSHWENFDSEIPAELLAGRLEGVPLLLVTIDGVESELPERLHRWFAGAGADDLGTLTLTSKLTLASADDRRMLAELLDVGAGRREAVQRAALDAIAAALNPPVEANPVATPPPAVTATTTGPAAPSGSELLVRLRDAGFLAFDAPPNVEADLTAVPKTGMRVALLSATDVALSNAAVVAPLAGLLAEQPGVSLVAADGTPVELGEPQFAALIRSDGELRRRITSVDDVREGYGQIALVLALEDLAGGVVGHYGIAGDQLLPAPNQ